MRGFILFGCFVYQFAGIVQNKQLTKDVELKIKGKVESIQYVATGQKYSVANHKYFDTTVNGACYMVVME